MRRLLLCVALVGSCGALVTVSYANDRRPKCTHGESPVAVEIYHGHVTVIDPETRTGC